MNEKLDSPRGVLNRPDAQGYLTHRRFEPSRQLSRVVEHFWFVRWELHDQPPKIAETLPHPSVHLVIEQGKTGLSGIHTRRFTRFLQGDSFVFGIKFLPASFHAFHRQPLSSLTNRVVDPRTVFGQRFLPFERAVLNASSPEKMGQFAEDFLLSGLPAPDPTADSLNELLARVMHDRSITRVEQLAAQFGSTVRTLQRLFRIYLGVSPKWVIVRYRIHEALEQTHGSAKVEWSTLAANLGYSDQAHFIRDFKSLIGKTPQDYRRNLG